MLCILYGMQAFTQSAKPGNYTLKVTPGAGLSGNTMYLVYRVNGINKTDSAVVKNNAAIFNGNTDEPVFATLLFKRSTAKLYHQFDFYLEAGAVNVLSTDSMASAIVSGSKTDRDFAPLRRDIADHQAVNHQLQNQYSTAARAHDTTAINKVIAAMHKNEADLKEQSLRRFIAEHPTSPVALYALNQYVGAIVDAVQTEPLLLSLAPQVQNLPSGKLLAQKIAQVKAAAVGQIAKGFSLADSSGKQITLNSYRGRYVLVDFWASWCGPCRAENPNVVKAFNNFGSKGFNVLGVSIDKSRDAWLKAVRADQLQWAQVLDPDQSVARQYGIAAIPQNLLLDPSGKIIGRNLRSEELQKVLADLFK